jgi:hypothetical protein
MKHLLTFDEFIKLLESKEYNKEKNEIEEYFQNLRQTKHILTYDEWLSSGHKDFVFLTYDLTGATSQVYDAIEKFLINQPLCFSRKLKGKDLTNNCFVAFLDPLNVSVMNAVGQQLSGFFSNYVADFKIYINISSDYFLHS